MSQPAKFWLVKGDGPASVHHGSRAIAEREADRLARQNPGTHFYVLEVVACHWRVDVERIEFDRDEAKPKDLIPF